MSKPEQFPSNVTEGFTQTNYTMNQPEEIKPCPWCNKNPEILQDLDSVYCFNPHCVIYRFEMNIKDWNTRTPYTAKK